jgi:CheY-like chemotaxis protein
MGHCAGVDGAPAGINPDHLKALASLPNALDADIRKIRHAVQLFSSILVPEHPAKGQVSEIPMRQDAMALHILLVEDELIHQEIALKQLAGRGRVDVAATGREALERVARESYDLVLLDLMLSGQDARGLIAELRASAGKNLRILLVSNMPLSLEDVRQLKADGALEKPFRFVSMESLLQQLGSGKPATV